MAKRYRDFTEEKYHKWLKEGRGQGSGREYRPWLTIQDVASSGKCSRIHGIKTDRQHDLLSDWETGYFHLADYSDFVFDIREQYPLLPREQTLLIADEAGIKHPVSPTTKVPIVMTTDFLITVKKDGDTFQLARTIKPVDELNKRQLEKFEIERRFWEKKNIDWRIVTDKEIDMTFAQNLSLCYQFHNIYVINNFMNITSLQIDKLVDSFKKMIIGKDLIIRDIASDFDERFHLQTGSGISIFKHLIITKQIQIDLFKFLDLDTSQDIYPYYGIKQGEMAIDL